MWVKTVAKSKVLMHVELKTVGKKFLEVIDNGFMA